MEKRSMIQSHLQTSPSKDVTISVDISQSEKIISESVVISNEKTDTDKYNKDLYFTEISQYSDIILPYNAEKDENYLNETLFVGDSNTAGLASFGYMPLQNVLGKKSMGIQGVTSNDFVWFKGYSAPVNIVTAVKLLKPRRIIINFGTNNTVGITTSEFISMYKKALMSIRNAYPYCDIIIASILPVGYTRENYNIKQRTIDSFNLALAQLCRSTDCRFLNYSEIFKTTDNGYMDASCVANDGIHLNNKGYNLLLEYINDHQYITTDIRPDTKNIPTRTNTPQNDIQQTAANDINTVIPDSAESTQIISNNTLPDSVQENSNNETISDFLSDSDTPKETEFYDPFL